MKGIPRSTYGFPQRQVAAAPFAIAEDAPGVELRSPIAQRVSQQRGRASEERVARQDQQNGKEPQQHERIHPIARLRPLENTGVGWD